MIGASILSIGSFGNKTVPSGTAENVTCESEILEIIKEIFTYIAEGFSLI